MFARLATLISIAAVATSALAAPGYGSGGSSQCSTGAQKCCNKEIKDHDSSFNLLSGQTLVDAVVSLVADPSVQCSPVNVLAVGASNTCTSQTVCCNNNNANGLVNIECTPITV